jgi:hypothetical protein
VSAYRQHDLVTTHNERVEQIMDAVEALLDNGFIIAKRLPDNPLNPVEVHVHRALIYEAVFGVDFEMFEEEEREMRARRNGESA